MYTCTILAPLHLSCNKSPVTAPVNSSHKRCVSMYKMAVLA